MKTKSKNKTMVSIRLDNDVCERLSKYCEDSGQSRTVAITRAILMYMDDYYEKMDKLAKLESGR